MPAYPKSCVTGEEPRAEGIYHFYSESKQGATPALKIALCKYNTVKRPGQRLVRALHS